MRVLKNNLLMLVMCLIVLGGCQLGFILIVDDSGDQRPKFSLMSAGFIERPGVEIDSFSVDKYPGKGEDIVWRIKTIGDNRHLVKEITYGIVPDGFYETISPQKLVSGGRYGAGTLMPEKRGYVEFVLK